MIAILLIATSITSLLVGLLLFAPNILQPARSSDVGLHPFYPEPEYERQLHWVIVSLAKRDSTLALQHETLASLPNYTRISLLLPRDNREVIQNELEKVTYRDRTEIITYESQSLINSRVWLLFPEKDKLVEVALSESATDSYNGSMWTQDLFEPMIDSSGRILLVQPRINKWYSVAGSSLNTEIVPDNDFLKSLSVVGLEIRRASLAFQGGNVLIDKTPDGRRVAFCGSDVLTTTRTVRSAVGDKPFGDEDIIADLKVVLNVDQVVVLSSGPVQPYLMYHLDQAMLLLSDRVVAIPRLEGTLPEKPSEAAQIEEVERFLSELRSTMSAMGYQVLDIETSIQNVLRCQHYVNAIPYTNAETGQKTVMMPIFKSAQEDHDLRRIARNTKTLESLGYEVIHVLTSADEYRGGIHCLVNVVS